MFSTYLSFPLWHPAKKAWISLLSHLWFRLARALCLQRESICWNHSCKDTWARPPAQTAVVEATHMSPTKDLKLHTQDMTVSLSSGPQPFRQLHLSSTPWEGVRRQSHLCKRRIQKTQTQHYAICLTNIISHWLLSAKHFPRAGHKRNSCCLPFWNLESSWEDGH